MYIKIPHKYSFVAYDYWGGGYVIWTDQYGAILTYILAECIKVM